MEIKIPRTAGVLGLLLLLPIAFINEGCSPETGQAEAGSPVISQISCVTTGSGDTVSGASFKNMTGKALDEVNAVFTFKTETAKDITVKRYWMKWAPDETKGFSMPENIIMEKATLTGSCTQGRLDTTWVGESPDIKRGFDPTSKMMPEQQGRREGFLSSNGNTRQSWQKLIERQTEKVSLLRETAKKRQKELEVRRSQLQGQGQVDQFTREVTEFSERLQKLQNEELFLRGLAADPKRTN